MFAIVGENQEQIKNFMLDRLILAGQLIDYKRIMEPAIRVELMTYWLQIAFLAISQRKFWFISFIINDLRFYALLTVGHIKNRIKNQRTD